MHLEHPSVGVSMDGSAMDVVSKVGLAHNKYGNVCHGAEIDEVVQFAFNKALINDGVEEPLHES